MSGWRALRCSTRPSRKCPAGVAPACPPWRGGAWAARPRTREQGRKESNPLRAGWSRTALPGARPCRSAAPAGLEPAPLPLTAGGTTVVLRGKKSQDGRIRTCVLVAPNHATTTAGPRPESRDPGGSRTHVPRFCRPPPHLSTTGSTCRAGGESRTHACRLTRAVPGRRASPACQHPREESNLALDLRTVACLRHTPRMSLPTQFRGLGSNQRQRVQSPPSYP
jgi:hypothetical protein